MPVGHLSGVCAVWCVLRSVVHTDTDTDFALVIVRPLSVTGHPWCPNEDIDRTPS